MGSDIKTNTRTNIKTKAGQASRECEIFSEDSTSAEGPFSDPFASSNEDFEKLDFSALKTEFLGMSMNTPLMPGAGCAGFGEEFEFFCPKESVGAFLCSGVTPEAKRGNKLPRVAEAPSGMINSVGLENPGLKVFLRDIAPKLLAMPYPVVLNLAGSCPEDYLFLCKELNGMGFGAFELNLSCPNVKQGCMSLGSDPDQIRTLMAAAKEVCEEKLIAKLTPNVTHIEECALAAAEGGADAVTLINTVLGMAINLEKRRPILANNKGGFSGPAIKPIALRCVADTYRAFKEEGHETKILGIGGISNGRDALEFICAGASALGVGSCLLREPDCFVRISREMLELMEKLEIKSLAELHGSLQYNE